MKKLFAAMIALALIASPVMAGTNQFQNWQHNRQNENWNNGNNYHKPYKKKRWYKNNNNNDFYEDPYFWGGVVGGIIGGIGGTIINRQNQYELPLVPQGRCREVMNYVWVDGIGYQPGRVVVCN